MKTLWTMLAASAFAWAAAGSLASDQVDAVIRPVDGATVGESLLQRTVNRVQAILRTGDLDPGSAVTVWWRIYNRPEHCAEPYACELADLANPRVDGSQLHAGAHLADRADGSAVIVATLYRTAWRAEDGRRFADSLSESHLTGRGLRRPMHAEVELLLASHGRVADPDQHGHQSALDQLLTPGATPVDCAGEQVRAARSFRCGIIQKVDHATPR